MDSLFIIAQAVGLLGTIATVATFQFKDKRHILLGNVVNNLLVALQFALLGGLSGAWVCIVGAVQTVVMYFVDRKPDAKKLWLCLLILFCAMYIVGTCIVYQGWGDILTCVCALFYVLAILQKDSKGFRRYILVNASVWIVYDIYTLAFSGMLTHGLALVSILVAMVRLDFKKKPKVVENGEAAENR